MSHECRSTCEELKLSILKWESGLKIELINEALGSGGKLNSWTKTCHGGETVE